MEKTLSGVKERSREQQMEEVNEDDEKRGRGLKDCRTDEGQEEKGKEDYDKKGGGGEKNSITKGWSCSGRRKFTKCLNS